MASSRYGSSWLASVCAACPMYSGAARLHAFEPAMIPNVVNVAEFVELIVKVKETLGLDVAEDTLREYYAGYPVEFEAIEFEVSE